MKLTPFQKIKEKENHKMKLNIEYDKALVFLKRVNLTVKYGGKGQKTNHDSWLAIR